MSSLKEDPNLRKCLEILCHDPICQKLIKQQSEIFKRMEPLMSEELHSLFIQREDVAENLRDRIKEIACNSDKDKIEKFLQII